jgi:hypothetical protein
MSEPKILKLTLDLTRCKTPQDVSSALVQAANLITANGVCPGGVWGGILLREGTHTKVGHWIVYPANAE